MWMFFKKRQYVLFGFVLFQALRAFAQDIAVTPYSGFSMPAPEQVTALAFSGDGKYLLGGSKNGSFQCWDLERKTPIAVWALKGTPIFVNFLSENKTFVAVDKSGNVSVIGLLSGSALVTFKSKGSPRRIALDAGKRYLAIASEEEWIEVFDVNAKMPAGAIDARGKIKDILFLGFDRLGEQLVAITAGAKAVSWNPSTQRLIREVSLRSNELHGSQSVIHAAATNRASNIFVVGLQEVALPKGSVQGIRKPTDLIRRNQIIAFDWNSGIEVKRVKTNWRVDLAALGPGNDHVVVINNSDNYITLIDLRKGEVGSSVAMAEKPQVLTVAETDRWLAAGAEKGKIAVWTLEFRQGPTAENISSKLPSLSGRIRTAQANTGPALSPDVPTTIAILPFQAKGISQDVADLCVDLMISSLANFSYITLVERNRIQEVMKEFELQMTGLTEQNGAEIGKLLNADNVILGSIGALGSSYLFNARILDVETGRVIKGRQVICEECRSQDIYDAVNLLISTIAR